jgi:hypothetical protein
LGLRWPSVLRRAIVVGALALLLAAPAAAQTGRVQRSVNIALLGGILSEKVRIDYVLYGPFGASGNFITPRPGLTSYQIPSYLDGKAAGEVKGFIWAAGCKIMKFEDLLVNSADVQESFSCSPLRTVNLVGRIRNARLSKKPVEVRVDYLAEWACNFFGLGDCMVPQIEVGIVKPDADGSFAIDLPDFGADPIASASQGRAEFQLVLREAQTWNPIAYLVPEVETLQTSGRSLKIVSSYPQNLVFAARKIN